MEEEDDEDEEEMRSNDRVARAFFGPLPVGPFMSSSSPAPASASSGEEDQEAKKLGCPKCRYAEGGSRTCRGETSKSKEELEAHRSASVIIIIIVCSLFSISNYATR